MSNAENVRSYSRSQTRTVVRENRLPVSIAELVGRKHIEGLVVKGFMRKMGEPLVPTDSMKSTSSLRGVYSQREPLNGETSRRWQRKDNVERYSAKRDTTNGE
jgi:hypothetical protein